MAANIWILQPFPDSVAIEFAYPDELQERLCLFGDKGQGWNTQNDFYVSRAGVGCMWISIASMCGELYEYRSVSGVRPIDGMRKMIQRGSREFMEYFRTQV